MALQLFTLICLSLSFSPTGFAEDSDKALTLLRFQLMDLSRNVQKYAHSFITLNEKLVSMAQDRRKDVGAFDKGSQFRMLLHLSNQVEMAEHEFMALSGYLRLVGMMGDYQTAEEVLPGLGTPVSRTRTEHAQFEEWTEQAGV